MSQETIMKILDKLDYKLDTSPDPKWRTANFEKYEDKYYFWFWNNFSKQICPNVTTNIRFHCATRDYKNIDSIVMIGFGDRSLRDVESPTEAIKLFEWLSNADAYLKRKGYIGEFSPKEPLFNAAYVYRYNVHTAFMEEFHNALLDFKNAYLGCNNNSKNHRNEGK